MQSNNNDEPDGPAAEGVEESMYASNKPKVYLSSHSLSLLLRNYGSALGPMNLTSPSLQLYWQIRYCILANTVLSTTPICVRVVYIVELRSGNDNLPPKVGCIARWKQKGPVSFVERSSAAIIDPPSCVWYGSSEHYCPEVEVPKTGRALSYPTANSGHTR